MITTLKEKSEAGYEWIDITNPAKPELNEVAVKYGLHKALVEDSLQPEHLPKYEMIGDVQFAILRVFSAKAGEKADTIQEVTDKIAVFIGNDFIITIHRREYDFLHAIKERYVETGKCPTPYQLLFRIISMAISTYEAPIAALIKELNYYEPKIFLQEKTPSLLKKLYFIKRKASVMDYVFDLSKTILDNLKGKISAPNLNHLKDEMLRLQTNTEQITENVGNLLNIYISLSSQRTNEVVRVLTVFSVFFMPLTFIVGVYGMNFENMPELGWRYGYLYVMLLIVTLAISIYIWFKRKGWF